MFGQASPSLASWKDLFRGDEVGNAAAPDIGKIQQFLITLLLVGTYCGMIWGSLSSNQATLIVAMPALSSGFVALMAISHASYLGYKVVPHTQTGGAAGSAGADPREKAMG